MTVNAQTLVDVYTGDGSNKTFDYNFYISAESELIVVRTDADDVETVVDASEYSVSGVGGASGGAVTYPISGDAVPSDEKVTLYLSLPLTQSLDLEPEGTFDPQTIELALDKVTRITGILEREVGRAVKTGISSEIDPDTLLASINTAVSTSGTNASAAAAAQSAAETAQGAAETAQTAAELAETNATAIVAGALQADQNLSDLDSAATSRTNLGVEIGADVQAYDANTMLSDTSARITANMGFTPASDTSSSGSVTFDFSTGNICKITLTEAITSVTIDGADAGDTLKIWITQAAGGYAVSGWASTVKWAGGGTAPTISTTSGAVDIITLEYDGTNYYAAISQDHQ